KAVGLDKGLFRAYLNLGIALKETGQPDEAILYCKEAIRINPDYAEAHYNLGNAYAAKGKLDEAKQSYQKTIDINTEHVLAHWNIALIHLTLGNFKDGWKGYELRWKLENNEDKRSFPQPLWDGSSLTDRTLFIYTEQGVGDEIMFASCLSEVITQTELCLVECDKRLVPVFERSFPKAKVIEKIGATNPYPPELPPFDLVVPIGSLPLYLRPDLSSFHKFIAYLVPDVSKAEFWHNRFKELGAGLKIGISWRGGSNPYDRLKRSIDLAQWKELFSITGIFFINLQYGDCNYELREAKENMGVTIYDWEDSDPLKDLDGFAAQISALDLVVSVDSATVHMAGALGKPVWTLLPFVSDWRWMLDREDTPWYPTMRLFRQPSPGDWKSVIDRVEKELKALISARFYGSARAALYAVEESSDDKNSE
ncbi:MAG: tetratricopeptide repeat protein, partial [Candidatus Methanoperedens sp.]|nr:tetratricopeptide repeat protein [Candidatus Methanoperedens sp.]